MYPHLQVLMEIESRGNTRPGAATYLHELGISKPGANEHHSVIQVGQALGNGCLGSGKRQVECGRERAWHTRTPSTTKLLSNRKTPGVGRGFDPFVNPRVQAPPSASTGKKKNGKMV